MKTTKKQFWISTALVNLCIVALLGVTLRSKILFPMQGVDFKQVLHAHSHFAFGGWITLALMTLMVYEILPAHLHNKKNYQWIFRGVLFNAAGMLISFLWQGYAFYSILFSTLFIFVTYAFCIVFTKDLLRSGAAKGVKILSISAAVCLALSSVGPFTLAYVVASRSNNNLLYRDAIYTYLHMQYNGFFSLGVFALFFNSLIRNFDQEQINMSCRFAWVSGLSILPTLFISFLWHSPTTWMQVIAVIGAVFIVVSLLYLIATLSMIKAVLKTIPRFTRTVGILAFVAFFLKSILQTGTIVPALGKLVYGDRAIIVGYLHLVLLGFITLYLLAHLLKSQILDSNSRFTRNAIRFFAGAVIANELVLMVQGFGNMLMVSNSLYTWLLWGISIWLFTGAVLITVARFKMQAKS